MQRRTCLKFLSMTILGGLLATFVQPPPSEVGGTLAHKLQRLFPHLKSARALGIEYLQNQAATVSGLALVTQLCTQGGTELHALAGMSDQGLRDWVIQQQQQDFAQGRTLRLKGWVLSQTEVYLYALLAQA